jgi:phage FluMu gp28-like protein
MFTASKPSMMWGNRVRIRSTHNGDDSFFNKLVKEVKKGESGTMKNWTPFKITIDDAIKEGLVDKILGHKASKNEIKTFLEDAFSGMTQEAIDEEFHCIPNSSSQNHVLALELITAVERDNILDEILSGIKGDIYVGMDVGRFNNPSVIWVLEKLGELLYTRKVICMKNTPWAQQREQLNSVLSHPNFRRCCIDNSAMGTELFENAQQTYGSMKVEGIKFTASVKDSLVSYLIMMVEDRKVLIPRSKTIREDFYSLKGIRTLSGNTRYETDSAYAEDDTHADHFWALALALEAAKTYSGPLIITSGQRTQMSAILANY